LKKLTEAKKYSNNTKFNEAGKVDSSVDENMDLSKGVYAGIGISLTEPKDAKIGPIYAEWGALNSHKLTLGTTRQGKSRSMAGDIEQQIAYGANVIVEEPKGSVKQEMFGYILEYAIKHKREQDIRYVSPYFKESSVWFNPIYGYKNEQIGSMVADIIDAKDAFYANIAKAIVLSATMGLEFLEKVGMITNPYDFQIMESVEYGKIKTRPTNKINKYILGSEYDEKRHGINMDIAMSFKKGKNKEEIALIEEALKRTELRYSGEGIDTVVPMRTFLTLRDLAQFETISALTTLYGKVQATYETIEKDPRFAHLKKLGIEAMNELSKISSRDAGFFSKVTTTYSTLMSDLITGDVGVVLNDSKINILTDDLTSPSRGIILFVQPFPMIYKSASEALGKILFYMLNSLAGYIGASGVALERRTYVNIDEAGSVLTNIVRELANKGGGLGFSLFLYTQSVADIEDTLEAVGARILMDNMNTKAIYKGNDPASLKLVSEMLGTRKKASAMGTSSDQRNTRVTVSTNDEEIATGAILSQLDARTFILKLGSEIYLVGAPNIPDAKFNVQMSIKSLHDISLESDRKLIEIEEMIL
jgi:hypothetical protein